MPRSPYVWLDAAIIKHRESGNAESTALATTARADSDGYRKLLRMDTIDTETYEGWQGRRA